MNADSKSSPTSLFNREYAFSLGGMFFVTFFAALALMLAGQVGPALPLLLFLTPLPPFLYVLLVRWWTNRRAKEFRHRPRVDALLLFGLMIAIASSLWMAGAIMHNCGIAGFFPLSRQF